MTGVFVFFAGANAFAQASLTAVGTPYTENFDGLGTANFSLTDNTSITGVYAFRTGGNVVPNVFTADTGTSATGQLKNYGSAAATDRALGSVSSGTPGTLYYGVRLVNNTGFAVNSVTVNYTGEQWRNGGNAASQTLAFDYQQAATVTSLTAGTFTPLTSLNFNTPANSATAAALDGNLPANRINLIGTINVTIPVGEEIMLRWTDINDTGNDHGLAIDDLSVTPNLTTAAAAAISGRVTTATGRGIQNVTLTATGNSLTEPVYVRTNAFGYYKFSNLGAGETYVVSATAKRYTFSSPSRVISLNGDFSGGDFTANK